MATTPAQQPLPPLHPPFTRSAPIRSLQDVQRLEARPLAEALVQRTRVARLLQGYRDVPAAHQASITQALVAVSQLLAELPELAELDINPLLVHPGGAIALDARVRTRGGWKAIKPLGIVS